MCHLYFLLRRKRSIAFVKLWWTDESAVLRKFVLKKENIHTSATRVRTNTSESKV